MSLRKIPVRLPADIAHERRLYFLRIALSTGQQLSERDHNVRTAMNADAFEVGFDTARDRPWSRREIQAQRSGSTPPQ